MRRRGASASSLVVLLVIGLVAPGCDEAPTIPEPSADRPSLYTGPTERTEIDPENALRALAHVLEPPPAADEWDAPLEATTGEALGLTGSAPAHVIARFLADILAAGPPGIDSALDLGGVLVDVGHPGLDGSYLRVTGQLGPDGTGELEYVWKDFQHHGWALVDGELLVTVKKVDSSFGLATWIDLATVDLRLRGSGFDLGLHGRMEAGQRLDEHGVAISFHQAFTLLDVVDHHDGETLRFERFSLGLWRYLHLTPARVFRNVFGSLYLPDEGAIWLQGTAFGCSEEEPESDPCDAGITFEGETTYAYVSLLTGNRVRVDFGDKLASFWNLRREERILLGLGDVFGPRLPNTPPPLESASIRDEPVVADQPVVGLFGPSIWRDVDDDLLSYAYAWLRNGEPIPDQESRELEPGHVERGDVLTLRVTADDLFDSVTVETSVVVENAPPRPALSLPDRVLFDDVVTLDASATADVDGDAVQLAWTILDPNGEPVPLADPASPTLELVASIQGEWEIRLDATDGESSDSRTWTLEVEPPPLFAAGAWSYAADGMWGAAVAIGDLDGDGLEDVAMAGQGVTSTFSGEHEPGLAVFHQQPDGRLRLGWRFDEEGRADDRSFYQSVAVGDVTGDGRNDLVFPAREGVGVFPQGAAGELLDPIVYPPGAGSDPEELVQLVRVADLNGDGRPDVVASSVDYSVSSSGHLQVLYQQPDGSLGPADTYVLERARYADLVVADYDGDSRTDLVVSNGYAGQVEVFLQQPDGSLEGGLAHSGETVRAISVGDGDRDGSVEIHAIRADNRLGVYSGEDTLALEDLGPLPFVKQMIEVGDLDLDGRDDIVLAASGLPADVVVYLRRPDASLQGPLRYPGTVNTGGVHGIAIGDVNDDGLPDVVQPSIGKLVVLYGKRE